MASQWFRSVNGALNAIAGYEAMNIIRKGQIRWVAKHDVVGQIRFIERTFGIAAYSSQLFRPANPHIAVCDTALRSNADIGNFPEAPLEEVAAILWPLPLA